LKLGQSDVRLLNVCLAQVFRRTTCVYKICRTVSGFENEISLYLLYINQYLMSSKYKVAESAQPHFVTFTVVGWIDVFSRALYKDILVNSLQYALEHKGLALHAWVIMTNHAHLIISSQSNKIHQQTNHKSHTGKCGGEP
jgi:hypothetical protein